MRHLFLASMIALAACSSQPDADAARDNVATAGAPAAAAPETAAGRAARAVAAAYFERIAASDFAGARALWADDGAASGGSAADLKRSFDVYARFTGHVGEASALKTVGAREFINVGVTAETTLKSGPKRDLSGFLYLRRERAAGADGAWRIWGADMRRHH